MLMESQDESVYRLTDEQVEEVRRRRANPNARLAIVHGARKREG
jgi:DNA-binding PadR family transcriptional regulator